MVNIFNFQIVGIIAQIFFQDFFSARRPAPPPPPPRITHNNQTIELVGAVEQQHF